MAPLLLIIALIAIAAGFMFAATSTYDFVAHLDRQVHGLHCSFLPGVGTPDATGTSGCHVTLMSPYSSIMRDTIWGGIPISLPAMAVFAFLGFWGVMLLVNDKKHDPNATGFFALATATRSMMWTYVGAVAFIVGHLIRLQVLTHRQEIEVSQLMGATAADVRRPFLHHGAVQGFLAGGLAVALASGLAAWTGYELRALTPDYAMELKVVFLPPMETLTVVLGAAGLGLAGAWIAVARELKRFSVKA